MKRYARFHLLAGAAEPALGCPVNPDMPYDRSHIYGTVGPALERTVSFIVVLFWLNIFSQPFLFGVDGFSLSFPVIIKSFNIS